MTTKPLTERRLGEKDRRKIIDNHKNQGRRYSSGRRADDYDRSLHRLEAQRTGQKQ